jgi:hypothetical protein
MSARRAECATRPGNTRHEDERDRAPLYDFPWMATGSDTFQSSSTLILPPMLAYARTRGVDVEMLVRDLGIAPSDLQDPDARIPETTRARAWSQAAASARDEAFGLHVAEHAPEGAYDVRRAFGAS